MKRIHVVAADAKAINRAFDYIEQAGFLPVIDLDQAHEVWAFGAEPPETDKPVVRWQGDLTYAQ